MGTDLIEAAVQKAHNAYEKNNNKGRLKYITNYAEGYQENIEYYMDVFGSTGKA